ncbi:MAG: lytic murein transglycosylase [Candidatus Parcubacteria bacterium]|nr:lytic murein transglycosylase [Candidatus Parcubacteria bacterium]
MKKQNFFFLLFILLLSAILLSPRAFLRAQSACERGALISPNDKAALQIALDECNKEITAQDQLLQGKQQERVSYERDVTILGAQIKKAQASINARNIIIGRLKENITEKTQVIEVLSDKIIREKDSVAQLLRKINEIDQASMAEVVLSKKNLSDFFLDIDSFNSIKDSLRTSLISIGKDKEQTETERAALEETQRKEADTRAELEAQKRVVQKNETEKAKLLSITKNTEKEYQKILAEKKALSVKIRAALFELRDSDGIQFGQAYEYALESYRKTGVRPAFLLAIFSQETSFGKNVGSCYLRDTTTGAGVGMNTGKNFAKVMKPGRDIEPFLSITGALGRDPFNTRVSCPQEVGYGGAMGPAQFIPSTWVGMQRSVANMLGKANVDPWNAEDAFMAASIYLRDLGAAKGGYSAERDAACRYFSGSKCSASAFVANYGNSVTAKATSIQENQIDKL